MQALKLIHSYISERKQFVKVDDKILSVKRNNFGVTQGNILGPVLFNLYIIDLAVHVTCDSFQYADDSTLHKYSKPKNLKKCIEELEPDLDTVSLWFSNNSLLFKDDKTKLMIFSITQLSHRHNLNNSELFKVMHKDQAIERVNSGN